MKTEIKPINVNSNINSDAGIKAPESTSANNLATREPEPISPIHQSTDPTIQAPLSTRLDLKIRARSFASKLTPEQLRLVYDWLMRYTVADVQKFIASPPPLGFGLEVHDMTLRRIKAICMAGTAPIQYENSSAAAGVIQESIEENPAQFAPLISELLLQKAFDLARAENGEHELKDLIHGVVKLRELDLKVQRLQLQREQARSRGSASPKRHHVDLNIIPPQRFFPPPREIPEKNEIPKSAVEK